MRRKSNTRTSNYRPGTSRTAGNLDTFPQQMAYFAKGRVLWRLRRQHPDRPSREAVAQAIGVSTKSVYEWEKHDGGIKWPNAKAAAAYYGVDPESITAREDEDGAGGVTLQVLDGPRAEQLDRIEKKVDEILERLSPPDEDQDDRGEEGEPTDPQKPLGPPPTPPDQVAPSTDEEDQQRKA